MIINEGSNIEIYKYKPAILTQKEENKAKVILLIGQTGNGKTTLINFLINTILGVKYDDNYRFKIIIEEKRQDESKSNTIGVNSYNIKVDGYYFPIKIIDSQGFGDTSGPKEDESIIEKIKNIFVSVNYINCVCLVVKETDIRLSSAQQYIYKSILDLFAKDIKNNFVIMITNSHFEDEPENITVLKTLQSEDSFFKTIIPSLEKPFYFQFENGALFTKGKKKRNKMDFEESIENMNHFLNDKLAKLRPILTKNSAKVCLERLQQRLLCRNLFKKREILINTKKLIEENKKHIIETKVKIIENPTIVIDNYEYVCIKKELKRGKYNTVCNDCQENCHEDCSDTRIFGQDIFKYFCACFDGMGYCKICKKKCPMSSHKFVDFEFVLEKKIKKMTIDQIFQKKCEKMPEEKNTIDKLNAIINKNNEELEIIKKQAGEMLEELEENLLHLNDLALNRSNYDLFIKIFDDLIKQEENLGNKENVEKIKQQKKDFILINDINIKGTQTTISHYEKAECFLI